MPQHHVYLLFFDTGQRTEQVQEIIHNRLNMDRHSRGPQTPLSMASSQGLEQPSEGLSEGDCYDYVSGIPTREAAYSSADRAARGGTHRLPRQVSLSSGVHVLRQPCVSVATSALYSAPASPVALSE
jgi:hypothetical protein